MTTSHGGEEISVKVKRIPLTQGRFAIVDDADFEYLNKWKWYYANGYAVRSDYSDVGISPRGHRCPKQVKMHRLIMGEPKGVEVDHRNGDRLDNQRTNLRVATKAQNQQNARTPRNNTSGFKGVTKPRRGLGWVAYIQRQYLGYFKTAEEAARAYNSAAVERYGQFARLNDV